MDFNERTREIIEDTGNYPKPPLVPLPEPNNDEFLKAYGIKLNPISRSMFKLFSLLTGFGNFQDKLPHRIETLLRYTNIRGPALFSPVVSATIALKDDVRNLDAVERATTLLFGAIGLLDDLKSGRFRPDVYRDQVLEMGQYPNLFSTCVTIEGRKARIFKSTVDTKVIVIINGEFFTLRVNPTVSDHGISRTKATLYELVETCQTVKDNKKGVSPGVLTCAKAATQRKAFPKLNKIKENSASLNALRHSLLTLCLDMEHHPSNYEEAALLAHSGNPANRWYHSSTQIIIFGNGKACATGCFDAYLDGNTMVRGFAEIQRRAANTSTGRVSESKSICPLATEKLNWKISRSFLERAYKDFFSIKDDQPATHTIKGIGRQFFSVHQIKAVPAFTIAVQMAAKKVTGKIVNVEQFLAMTKYRCMDLARAIVTTPETIRFVEYVEGDQIRSDVAVNLFYDAVQSHENECRKHRSFLPYQTIVSIFVLSQSGYKRYYIWFALQIFIWLLRLMKMIQYRGNQVVLSHPAIYSEVQIVGRPGIRLPYLKYFAMNYQIFQDEIVITMQPAVKFDVSNKHLIKAIEESIGIIQTVIEDKIQ